jgi:hypothetical protein
MKRSELDALKVRITAIKTARDVANTANERIRARLEEIKGNALYRILPSWVKTLIERIFEDE